MIPLICSASLISVRMLRADSMLHSMLDDGDEVSVYVNAVVEQIVLAGGYVFEASFVFARNGGGSDVLFQLGDNRRLLLKSGKSAMVRMTGGNPDDRRVKGSAFKVWVCEGRRFGFLWRLWKRPSLDGRAWIYEYRR